MATRARDRDRARPAWLGCRAPPPGCGRCSTPAWRTGSASRPAADLRPASGWSARAHHPAGARPTHPSRAARGCAPARPVHVDVVGAAESEPEPRDGRRVDAARPEHGEEHRPGRRGERRRLQPRLLERALHADGAAGRAASARDDHGDLLVARSAGYRQRIRTGGTDPDRAPARNPWGSGNEGAAQDPEELAVLAQRPPRFLAGRECVEHGAEVVRVERSDEATHRSGQSCIGRATAGVFVAVRDEGLVGHNLLQTLRARPGPGAAIAGTLHTAADAGLSREARAGLRCTGVGARGFEPPTPCAQGRCATRLRYAPSRFS